jgi:hypothetical protein
LQRRAGFDFLIVNRPASLAQPEDYMSNFYKKTFCALAVSICFLAGLPAQNAQAQQNDNNGQNQYNNSQDNNGQYNNNQGQYNNSQDPNGGQQDQQQADNSSGSVTMQTFYDDLAPYGQWVQDPQYGDVFVPNVEQGFRPYYTDGHWVMTDYGNTWVSDYQWGWACFHYGRWTYDSYYGWVWVPGTEWGPSWVGWRNGDGYYGWAPLSPGYEIGAGDYNCPDDWWVFIPPQYIYSPNYYHYWGGPGENGNIIHHTNFIHNTFVNGHVTYSVGPRASEIEGLTHQPVNVYKIDNSNNPNKTKVRGNTVKMFHPTVSNGPGNNGARPTPPNLIHAAQPIGRPQAASGTAAPAFRNDIQKTNPSFAAPAPGKRQQPEPQGSTPQRYEWDVNKPQPQQAQQPRNAAPAPQQQFSRPQPQQQAPRPQSAPQVSRPAPQMSRPAPAPAPHFSAPAGGGGFHGGGGGGRR